MAPVDVSLIIPAYGLPHLTAACAGLALALSPGAFEVLIVDDGSQPPLALALGADPRLRIVRLSQNQGFAASCNRGAREARGAKLFFLNNDAFLTPGWWPPLLRALEQDGAAAAGSLLLLPDGTIQCAGVTYDHEGLPCLLFHGLQADLPAARRPREVQGLSGAALMIERERFLALDGFDTGYQNSYEDVDLGLRLRRAGGRLLVQPESVAIHLESSSPGRQARDAANLERFVARWTGRTLDDDLATYRAEGLEQHYRPRAERHRCGASEWNALERAYQDAVRYCRQLEAAVGSGAAPKPQP